MTNLSAFYDSRYRGDYRQHLTGYEIARWEALAHFIRHVTRLTGARTVVDYGCGRGAFIPLWQTVFPNADLYFCEISEVALASLKDQHPQYAERLALIQNDTAALPSGIAEVVVSVEVMEHVADLEAYLRDIFRLLKPGGHFIWTTPCANAGSVEHVYNTLTGKIERTPTGGRRWTWEDPSHLRRLTSAEAGAALTGAGFAEVDFRFRAHLFSALCSYTPLRRLPEPWAIRLMKADYDLFRRLPNGASMIGVARRPAAAGGPAAAEAAPETAAALAERALAHARTLPPAEALRFLFELENRLYPALGQLAVAYGGGTHTKHRHLRYHDFFVARVRPGERVLDIGCGSGAVAYDLAEQAGAEVTGIDLAEASIAQARAQRAHPRARYLHGDALTDLPEAGFDVIVMSNVLEHIDQRVAFLRQVQARYHPDRWLLRVPLFERDWRVPLKAELGMDYRLDPTHFIEYTHETFAEELRAAGLTIRHLEARWGELWVEAAAA